MMERLTIRNSDGSVSQPTNLNWVEALEKLAAYEDTGLTPKVVQIYFDTLVAQLFGKDAAPGAVTMERLGQLADADREGRAVVLPCKASGVTVYQLRRKNHAKGPGVSPRIISCTHVYKDGHYAMVHMGCEACTEENFGKTWFLTQEEAEAAVEKGAENA